MKGSIEEKRQELKALEASAQREHVEHALALAKGVFPETSFVQQVTKVSIVSHEQYEWIMSNRLQGGSHDQGTLFSISSEINDWTLFVEFKQGELNYPRWQPLYFTLGKTSSIVVPLPITIAETDFHTMPVQLLAPRAKTEKKESYIIRVSEFWAHLEAFIVIYRKQMETCPMESERPIHDERFMHHFANIRRGF